jgi:hypothetical protein
MYFLTYTKNTYFILGRKKKKSKISHYNLSNLQLISYSIEMNSEFPEVCQKKIIFFLTVKFRPLN